MNKKAEMTTAQLIGLIVLIVSFAILLYFLFRLNLGGTTNEEICRNSVIAVDRTKGTLASLDCRTNYVCISGGDDCSETFSTKVKVNPENKDEIMKAIADEAVSCWNMFGEGKANYIGPVEGAGITGGVYCGICSTIRFDDKIQEKTPKITYLEYYNFLQRTKKSDYQTYLNYLYGTSDVGSLRVQDAFKIVDINNDFFATREKYSLITGTDTSKNLAGTRREFFGVYIIPTIETPATSCTDFITKA
ncbi:MAG: hypothetical protein AABX91_00320 [Nanoarchaeota archaeon]